jgi:hypothetical protein
MVVFFKRAAWPHLSELGQVMLLKNRCDKGIACQAVAKAVLQVDAAIKGKCHAYSENILLVQSILAPLYNFSCAFLQSGVWLRHKL